MLLKKQNKTGSWDCGISPLPMNIYCFLPLILYKLLFQDFLSHLNLRFKSAFLITCCPSVIYSSVCELSIFFTSSHVVLNLSHTTVNQRCNKGQCSIFSSSEVQSKLDILKAKFLDSKKKMSSKRLGGHTKSSGLEVRN